MVWPWLDHIPFVTPNHERPRRQIDTEAAQLYYNPDADSRYGLPNMEGVTGHRLIVGAFHDPYAKEPCI